MSDLSTDNARMVEHADRLLCKLGEGRFVMATFVVIEAGELLRDETTPSEIRPPRFLEVVEACELIGQGACRAFAGLKQVTG